MPIIRPFLFFILFCCYMGVIPRTRKIKHIFLNILLLFRMPGTSEVLKLRASFFRICVIRNLQREGMYMVFGFSGIIILVIIYFSIKISNLENRVEGLHYKLDTIKAQTNVSGYPVDEELLELLGQGEEIKAVKKARQAFGLSLVEGKRYVDNLKTDNS